MKDIKEPIVPDPPPPPALRLDVLERRLQNPFGVPSETITLKQPGWTVRIFNAAIAADHVWRATHKGWEFVRWSELAAPEQAGGFQKGPDGRIVRGERGQEVLMKIPTADWARIQRAKEDANLRVVRNPGAQADELKQAGAVALGHEAEAAGVSLRSETTDSRERIAVTPD